MTSSEIESEFWRLLHDYLKLYPGDYQDLISLCAGYGATENQESMIRIFREANGRRIITYHLREHVDPVRGMCDPPIYWRYSETLTA